MGPTKPLLQIPPPPVKPRIPSKNHVLVAGAVSCRRSGLRPLLRRGEEKIPPLGNRTRKKHREIGGGWQGIDKRQKASSLLFSFIALFDRRRYRLSFHIFEVVVVVVRLLGFVNIDDLARAGDGGGGVERHHRSASRGPVVAAEEAGAALRGRNSEALHRLSRYLSPAA